MVDVRNAAGRRRVRLKPLRQWVCDACRRLIRAPEQGAVTWVCDPDGSHCRGFRIVHTRWASPLAPDGRCDRPPDGPPPSERLEYDHVTAFVDRGSVGYLLTFLDPGPDTGRTFSSPGVLDLAGWVELTRRLCLPHYEEARFYLDRAAADGYFRNLYPPEIYHAERLRRVIERYGD